MSRVILSKYPNGQERVVVGWDHPCRGAFWQEFALEPDGEIPDDWDEMLREGGFVEGISLNQLIASMPEDLVPLMSQPVMALLRDHASDPDSGDVLRGTIDLS